jgi:exodeoxyribonuclease VII small subunit
MPARKKTKQTVNDFEKSMGDLESLVEAMESGELTLEESLEHFERGIKQVRSCQQALDGAEQKVKILLDDTEDAQLNDFDQAE